MRNGIYRVEKRILIQSSNIRSYPYSLREKKNHSSPSNITRGGIRTLFSCASIRLCLRTNALLLFANEDVGKSTQDLPPHVLQGKIYSGYPPKTNPLP